MLEMEERVDINLTEGMPPSPPQTLLLETRTRHLLTHLPTFRPSRQGHGAGSGRQLRKKQKGLNFRAAPSESRVQFICQNGVYKKRLFTKWSKVFMRRLERMQRGRSTRAELIN